MLKKFKQFNSILLILCIITNLFYGIDTYASEVDKHISINVEGIHDSIVTTDNDYTTEKTTVYDALYEVLEKNNIPIVVEDGQYGKYVSSINNETAGQFGGYDGWIYAVNGVEGAVSMDSCNINEGDNILVYYGGYSPQTYIPKVALSSEEITTGNNFTVDVTATYFDWNENNNVTVNVTGAAITLLDKTYTTDDNGQSVITAPNTAGDYTLKISQDRENNYPLIVRTTKQIKVVDSKNSFPVERQTIVNALDKATDKLIEKFDDSKFNYQKHWMSVAINGFDKKVPATYLDAINNGDMPAKNSGQYGKYILGILAAGGDPTNINGRNLMAELCQLDDMKNVSTKGGIYSTPFGLLALDAINYEIPVDAGFTREDIIDKLVSLANPKGAEDGVGFVLTALGKYYNEKPEVKEAVDKVVAAWADRQSEYGGYGAGAWSTDDNVNTAAQVLMGLSSNGIDPQSKQFTKAKGNLVSFILSLQNEDGTFNWQKNNAGSISMATEQATYALDQYLRELDGKKSIYDFTSEKQEPDIGGVTPQPKKYVTLSVDKLTINKGYVISPTQAELQSGDTAWTLMKRELDARGINYKYMWSEQYDSVYVQSIDGDGEFDHGSGSGWMYSVNGNYPNYGASKYVLKAGDKLSWRYTTNLGEDLGGKLDTGESGGGHSPVTSTDDKKTDVVKDDENKVDESTEENTNDVDLKKIYNDEGSISSWAYKAISDSTQKGFVAGSNGNFNPKSNITRAEFTKIIVAVLGLDTKIDNVINFKDVKEENWFYPYINTAYKAGIIKGSGSNFNPNDKITREQMAAIIVKALGVKPVNSTTVIKDINKVSNCFKEDVQTVFALGFMVGDGNKFNPGDFVTREMAAVVAIKVYDYKNGSYSKNTPVESYINETAALLQKTVSNPVVSSIGGEWTVMSLARSGIDVPQSYYTKYYSNVEKKLKESSGKLSNVKYTEYDRVILALGSIGRDITNVAGYDLTKPLADFNAVIKQGLNGPVWALIALDSNNYQIPVDNNVAVQTTREKLIDYILSKEIKGGGWSLTSEAPADTDITAMTLQALSRYKEDEKVSVAIDRALGYLSSIQQKDGSYNSSWGNESSCESIAQVIVALTSLGINPVTDTRFIKDGNDTLTALLGFYVQGGGFKHVMSGQLDAMATDQGMYALVAYNRFIAGQKPLYDMSKSKA